MKGQDRRFTMAIGHHAKYSFENQPRSVMAAYKALKYILIGRGWTMTPEREDELYDWVYDNLLDLPE